jgi:hypothetical protein
MDAMVNFPLQDVEPRFCTERKTSLSTEPVLVIH